MPLAGPAVDMPPSAPVPVLLVELPPWHHVFFGNLRDLAFPRSTPPLQLQSAPASFWPDVFVQRPLPWDGFLQSFAYHLVAFGLMLGLSHLLTLQPRVESRPALQRADVIYYSPSEYLPPLDTRSSSAAQPAKADPAFSRQPIISVPPEADNHSQTIVTPPKLKLRRDVAMPNIVAWSEQQQKPRLDIPAAPLTPAAERVRIAPTLQTNVVAPTVDTSQLDHRRNIDLAQNSVVAPPPDVRVRNVGAVNTSSLTGLKPSLIAPPPTVEASATRPVGTMNMAPSAVIAPAPQLPVAAQRTIPGGGLASEGSAQVVPPPPSVASGAAAGASFGARGRLVALSAHPAIGAPPDPNAGNRRGSFAATPTGHPNASGTPGAAAGTAAGSSAAPGNASTGSGTGTGTKDSGKLPSGLYVAGVSATPSSVAGNAANASPNTVNPNLIASVRPPRVGTARVMQPDSSAKLTEAERAVFGNRRFYSVTLNMPNLNSAGGSWIIRFAELNHRDASTSAPPSDLTQPMAIRKVDPAYPIQLMRENVSGTVILYAVIHADGSVGGVRVLRGVDERLDRFASEAVAQWKFDPATRNGAPVDVEATFQIPFRPARVGTNF